LQLKTSSEADEQAQICRHLHIAGEGQGCIMLNPGSTPVGPM